MAAKSDFAQKLLSDLRLRKQRMGAPSNATARDAYRNPGNVQRGSRQTKSLESIGGPKMANQQHKSSRASAQPPSIKESSQQIVSYAGGRYQRSESVAFTYEVKNGGKLMNVDFSGSNNANTMINFLTQIGQRSLDVGNSRNQTTLVKHTRNSNGGVVAPALTTIQIKEISKGVQNLYEILRSSSNGMNVERYSMEVGKELLKGAKGLEESLRMLVNLQEASELMVNPQRKSRITLLEVEEDEKDDNSKTMDQNQVALPRFSFDKPSRKSNIVLADGSSKLPSHQRSASYGAESVRTVKNGSSHSEKGRISNVIAKLMGLEDIPGKLYSNSTQGESKTSEPRIHVNKTSRPPKDDLVSFNDRNAQQIPDSNIKKVPRLRNSDQLLEKKTKEKIQPKRRSPEVAANLGQERIDKKKTSRTKKNNEIKLVPGNNRIQEPKTRKEMIKQDLPQTKQVKHTNPPPKEPQIERNLKPKDATPKAQESERTQGDIQPPFLKEKIVIRKKVDSMVVRRTEAPRVKDEVLKRRNGTINNLATPSKHKLSVLKETKRKEAQPLVPVRLKPEETNIKRSISKKSDSTIQLDDMIINTICNHETFNVPESKPKKAFYPIIQVVLTENEKQLKEILIKDQLFLSTADSLFKLNIPVGFLHVDDHNHHEDDTKLKLDCGYEILKRKARRQELSAHPMVKPSVGGATIRFLDELVKQLYKDLESLLLYGRNAHNENDEADYMHHMLERDIYSPNPDINSFWDFGWHTTTFMFVEKDEFVNDVERDVFYGLVDEIVDEMLNF